MKQLVADFPGDKDALELIAADELLRRAKRGLVTVLDARLPEEFAAGHLRGAVNIPIDKLESGLAKLSKRRVVCSTASRSGRRRACRSIRRAEPISNRGRRTLSQVVRQVAGA